MMNTDKSESQLKITWGDLVKACENAGIRDEDIIDGVYITWGGANELKCENDEDFGWQITLDCDC